MAGGNVFIPAFPVLDSASIVAALGYTPVNQAGDTMTGNLTLPAAGALLFNARAQFQSPADGIVTLLNNAGTGFTRLNLGGTTSSFAALGHLTNTLQAVLADGSGWANFQSGVLSVRPDTGVTAGGSATMALNFGSNGGTIYTGSGAPTVSGAKGSLYLRTDGSGVNDRAYINTNGSTTWTALVTVA